MEKRQLGTSDVQIHPICLGTMTFGEQVDEATAHTILEQSIERGVDFMDTAEMYAVPPSAATFNATERIIGNWFAKHKGMRDKWVVATKVAGPSRDMAWIRNGSPTLRGADIIAACEGSLQRLQTDVIDIYQIHWPTRNVPMFGGIYFKPSKANVPQSGMTDTDVMLEQLQAMDTLVKAGKIRAFGVSNETPFGVQQWVNLAEKHNLPRLASVQNPYCLTNRSHENGLDEIMHQLQVSMLAYSPLGFGLLTGKYDDAALAKPLARGRMDLYERMQAQRWARPDAITTSKLYNDLARAHGLTATQLAMAYCYQKWSIASTIMGCTTAAQMHACYDAYEIKLSPEILQAIDAIRWQHRDPAQ